MTKEFDDEDFNPLLDSDEDSEEETLTLPSSDSLSLPVLEEKSKPEFGGFKNQEPEESRKSYNADDFMRELTGFDEEFDDELTSDDFVEVNGTIDELVGVRSDSDSTFDDGGFGDNIEDLFADVPEEDTSSESFANDWGMDDEDDPLYGFDLDVVLSKAIDMGASDVHVSPYDNVCFTILGDIHRVEEYGIVSGDVTRRVQQKIISNVLESDFIDNLELDTSYVLRTGPHKGRRTRLNIGKSFSDIYLVFRIISNTIPSPEDLGLEKEIVEWSELPNGLVLINGPTGTGKTTLIASLMRHIQTTRPERIVTVEKPIEFVYGRLGISLITQREVGPDTREFKNALKSAMRMAPNRMLVGEVRDQEEVDALLQAAETGHWAISTIHATSAPTAVNRIKSLYEGPELLRVLGSFADNIRGMANQVLVKTPDGESRFGVREILSINDEVADMIRRGDTEAMRKYQIDHGITMEHSLAKAVRNKKVTREEARKHAQSPSLFDRILKES